MVASAINDTAGYPRMGIGSLGGYAVIKTGFMFFRPLRSALLACCDFSNIRYSDWSVLPQRSITVAPILSISRKVGKRFSAGMRGGYGVKFSPVQNGASSKVIIAGASTGYSF